MPRLTFPPTGDVREFSERRAAVKRRDGWGDVEPAPPAPDPAPDFGGFLMTEPTEED